MVKLKKQYTVVLLATNEDIPFQESNSEKVFSNGF